MAKKKKNGGGMSTVRKWGKKILSGVRVVVLVATTGHGLISTGTDIATGAQGFEQAPRLVTYYYTGFNTADGSWDKGQAVKSVATIGGGVLASILISFGIRHI